MDPNANGEGRKTLCKPNRPSAYLSIFINHFLSPPSRNSTLLNHLFVEKSWSAAQIAQISGWGTSTIKDAISQLGLTRPRKSTANVKYGEKIQDGQIVPHVREAKNIDRMVRLREQGLTLQAIAEHLNKAKIRTKLKKKWDSRMVWWVLDREKTKKGGKDDA